MSNTVDWVTANWPAPAHIHAGTTLRIGGVSHDPWCSLNLGDHVGDDPVAVKKNRQRLIEAMALPSEPTWLTQEHKTDVARLENTLLPTPCADASVTHDVGKVCVVLTADCLPVLFCNRKGTVVAAAHAGWRGLVSGVLEATVAAMDSDSNEIIAWMGPAIGPRAFEVGDEVREAFLSVDVRAETAFVATASGKWLADIYTLARQRLQRIGVAIYGGGYCTLTESERFFSYRRDGVTGRQASLVWISEHG